MQLALNLLKNVNFVNQDFSCKTKNVLSLKFLAQFNIALSVNKYLNCFILKTLIGDNNYCKKCNQNYYLYNN